MYNIVEIDFWKARVTPADNVSSIRSQQKRSLFDGRKLVILLFISFLYYPKRI